MGLLATKTRQSEKWFRSERQFLLFIQSGKLVTGSSEVTEGSNLYTQWETEFIEEMPPLSLPISQPRLLPGAGEDLSESGHALVFLNEK